MSRLVYITTPACGLAEKIAVTLVEERLAAGVHIAGPIRSVYRWDGKIHRKKEWIILAQIPQEAFARVEETVADMHPYKVPCILEINIDRGHKSFLDWIENAGECKCTRQ